MQLEQVQAKNLASGRFDASYTEDSRPTGE